MRTFYEEVCNPNNHNFWTGTLDGESAYRKQLELCEIFNVQNVADYYWGDVKDWWDFDDFPNVAPPFNNIFMEYNRPERLINDHSGDYAQLNGAIAPDRLGMLMIINTLEIGWKYHVFIFSKNKNDIFQGPIVVSFDVDEKGIVKPNSYVSRIDNSIDESYQKILRDGFWSSLCIGLLAISFLHCKNVRLIENRPHKSPSGRNKNGPHITFKTLEINPMRQILRDEGHSEITGLRRALHICRGHFKDYSEKGLFGRYKGIYWWDSQVRGKIENGIVIKNYEVKSNG